MTAKLTPVIVLERANALLADPKSWTQGSMAKDAIGRPVDAYYQSASCFCIVGVLERAAQGIVPDDTFPSEFYDPETYDELCDAEFNAGEFVRSVIMCRTGSQSIPSFNDNRETTHSEVVEVLAEALANARLAAV